MDIIWPGGIKYNNVLLFVFDTTPYKMKVGTVLKNIYTTITYVTCCAHRLHRIAEFVDNLVQ
jgi:hypothetical protein